MGLDYACILGVRSYLRSVRAVPLAPECVGRFGVLTAAVRIKVHTQGYAQLC